MRDRSSMVSRQQLFGNGASAERMPSNTSHGAAGTGLFGRSSGVRSSDGSVMRDVLEEENDRLTSELEMKVAALKGATQSIHDEVSEQNRILSGMGSDFDKTGGLMGSTLKRLDSMIKIAGGSTHMCTLIGGMVLVLTFLWWLMR
jgi:hypothetical protein